MKKCKTLKLIPHGRTQRATGGKQGAADPGSFGLVVGNPNGTLVTIMGTDAAGNVVDISSVATITVTPDDPTIATATVNGMSYSITLLKAGDVTFTVTATWSDGSDGPFALNDPCTVEPAPPGPVTGLVATHDTPTSA